MRFFFVITAIVISISAHAQSLREKVAFDYLQNKMAPYADSISEIRSVGFDTVLVVHHQQQMLEWQTKLIQLSVKANKEVNLRNYMSQLVEHMNFALCAYEKLTSTNPISAEAREAYRDHMHRMFLFEIKKKDGSTETKGVIMERNRLDPLFTSDDYITQLEKYKNDVVKIYNAIEVIMKYETGTE